MICIELFKWRDVQSLWVNLYNPSEVARVVKSNIRKGLRALDTNRWLLGTEETFDAVIAHGTNTS